MTQVLESECIDNMLTAASTQQHVYGLLESITFQLHLEIINSFTTASLIFGG